jgi:hypothetical protein
MLVAGAADGAWGQSGKEPPENGAQETRRREIVEHMRAIAMVQTGEQGASEAELIDHPLLHYTDPARANDEGSLWAWGKTGRPLAMLELYRNSGQGTRWIGMSCGFWSSRCIATRMAPRNSSTARRSCSRMG